MIRVLIVDDSPSTRLLLAAIIGDQADMQVVGLAHNGGDALKQVRAVGPDVITMDVRMPVMDGIEATGLIMERQPTPVVIVSSALGDPDLRVMFRALEVGAVAVLDKPPGPGDPRFSAASRELVETLRAMATVKVVRRHVADTPKPQPDPTGLSTLAMLLEDEPPTRLPMPGRVLAIAASTGGPQVLAAALSKLPADYPLAIVVVQHISPGFIEGMVDWLNAVCRLKCRVARDGDPLEAGLVLFAPDGQHLRVVATGYRLYVALQDGEMIDGHRPAATALFESVARACGARAVGLVLTGMGVDGASGLAKLRIAGGLTLAQSPDSCVVPNMPQAAIDLKAVDEVLPLAQLPQRLQSAAQADFRDNAITAFQNSILGGDLS